MKVPFKYRSLPPYAFDGDGRFPFARIKGFWKRLLRKRQIKRYLKTEYKE